MHISRFWIRGYKSVKDSSPCSLSPGLSIVVGQNNSGKSALLEALSLHFENKPHGPSVPGGAPESEVEVDFTLPRRELLTILARKSQTRTIFAPKPSNDRLDPQQAALLPFEDQSDVVLTVWVRPTARILRVSCRGIEVPNDGGQIQCVLLRLVGNEDNLRVEPAGYGALLENRYWPVVLATELLSRTALIQSTNPAPGRALFGTRKHLSPDCSNLAEVLNVLQSDPDALGRLNSFLNQILPSVRRVSVRPLDERQAEILVWPSGSTNAGIEYAAPLGDSGTGVGQVLSILYPIVTAEDSRILLIDEPQSFLHPGALRKLMNLVLQHADRHQFIISTNSPAVLPAASRGALITTELSEGRTTASTMTADDISSLRSIFADLGVRNSDVFGADSVLWVEGPTEQGCFAEILAAEDRQTLLGATIVPVRAVDDLTRDDAELVFDLYDRFATAATLLPPAVAFIFDRETRSQEQQEELSRRGKGKVQFLPRRMYENFLLHAEAIAVFCNSQEGFDTSVTPEAIREWFLTKGRDPKYGVKSDIEDHQWFAEVRADKILTDLVTELSCAQFVYRKREHGLALTKWLLRHDPAFLSEVRDLLKPLFRGHH